MFISFLQKARAIIMRTYKPKNRYYQAPIKSLEPLSSKYGFDRGMPIDRYYIERFIERHASLISGRCLEIHDTNYLVKFGSNRVTKAEALDIDRDNKQATLYGDLRDIPQIASDRYDCIILTHTLGVIDDYEAAVREVKRILKPGGHVLVTVSAIGIAHDIEHSYWRFTSASANYVFKKYFNSQNVTVESFGNVLSGQAFWVGMAAQELAQGELNYNDPRFPVVIGIVAQKEFDSELAG